MFQEVEVTIFLNSKKKASCRCLLRYMAVQFNAWLAMGYRLKAWCARDEYRRLKAAGKMKNWSALKHLALEANQQSIRHQAAMRIESEAFLTAVALNAWDIEQGQRVVARIENELLLRRISSSARQDAVRLSAAEKLGNSKVLKQIALSSADLSLRWEVAQRLNDPDLMADVALFRPSRTHTDTVRKLAHEALLHYLDELSDQRHYSALLDFIHAQAHLPFKLEAFLRLPQDYICNFTLQYLARFDFFLIPDEIIQRVFVKIRQAGWHTGVQPKCFSCRQCQGKGHVLIKTISTGRKPLESDITICPECCGKGWIDYWEAVCTRGERQMVVFRLPHSELLQSGYLPA